MATPSVILNYDLQPSPQAQSKLQAQMATLERSLRLNGPFSGMAKSTQDFNYQLDRATQRVITLGTAFGILSASNRVLQSIVSNTIAVDKAMVNLNAIFKLTNDSVTKLTANLFDLSREAATPFAETAKAAEEFARQGLSANRVLEATRAALILSRDAGIDVTDSVKALTAATNSFSKEALGYIQIANRIATVDTSFAVSSKDLQEALVRTGSAASDAGLSFNQFIGLVTSAQQISQRGGAVISQALNTIFTRIGRKDTLDSLEGLGVAITDLQGQTLPTITILQNFAKAYDGMTGSIKNQAAELVGGVRNLNTLKATLKDLSRENSVFAQSQQLVANSTNQAEARNAARNQSLSAQFEQLKLNGQQIGANIGNVGFNQNASARGTLSLLNNNPIIDALKDAGAAETAGGAAAQAFIKGFGGAVLFGLSPILVSILGSLGKKVFGNLAGDLINTAKLNDTQRDQAAIEKEIVTLYQRGGAALEQQLATMTSLTERAAYLKTLLSAGQAGASFGAEAAAIYGGGYRARRAAGGYIPMGEESAAIAAGVGGAPLGAKPVYLPNFNLGGGQRGIVGNTSEWIVPHMAGGSAIYNQDMIRRGGLPPGSVPVAAGGYMPNAAGGLRSAAEIALGTSTNAPTTAYQAAIQRAMAAEKELETVWTTLTDRFSAKLKQSIATLNINQQFAGLGGVLTQGPTGTADQIKAGALSAEIRRRVDQALTQSVGGAGNYTSRPWSGQPYQGPQFGMNNIPYGSTRSPLGASTLSDTERIKAVYRQQMVEEKQAARQGEIVAMNARQEKLRARLADARLADPYDPSFVGPRTPVGWRSSLPAAAPRGPGFLSRLNTSLNSPGAALALGIGLPFLGSNINEGVGGTPSGQLRGAASNALNFGGFGATAGSLLPIPGGTATGAIVGAAIGGLYGWITKASKSFEELATELDQASKKRGEEFTHVMEVFDIQDQLKEATQNGDKEAVQRLRQARGVALSNIHRRDYLDIIGSGKGREAATDLNGSEVSSAALQDALKLSLQKGNDHSRFLSRALGVFGDPEQFVSGFNNRDIGAVSQSVQNVLGNGSFSRSQIGFLQKQNQKSPQKVLETIARAAGLSGEDLQAVLQQGGPLSAAAVADALHSALNQDPSLSGKLDKSLANDRARTRGLLSQSEKYREQGAFGSISSAATRQIEQVRQQILLQDPSLTDTQRLQYTNGLNRFNISAQINSEKNASLSTGKAQLLQSLVGAKGLGSDVQSRIEGLTSAADIRALLKQSALANGSGGDPRFTDISQDNPTRKALEELANRMEELDKTEQENIRANEISNTLQMEQLRQSKSYSGGTATSVGANRTAQENLAAAIARQDSASSIRSADYTSKSSRVELLRRLGLLNEDQAGTQQLGLGIGQSYDARLEAFQNSKGLGSASRVGQGVKDADLTLQEQLQLAKDALSVARRLGEEESAVNAKALSVFDLEAQARRNNSNYTEGASRIDRARFVANQVNTNQFSSGSEIAAGNFGLAKELGLQGDSRGSLVGGFKSVFAGLKRDLADFSDIGQQTAQSLVSSFNNAWDEFVTGAKKGKDAFRDFATSILGDASRMLASKAISGILSSIPGFGVSTGGPIGLAGGGMVPAMLTGGEYVMGPTAARRAGYETLRKLNGYADGGFVRGGSGVHDDVPANLPVGSFVIRKAAAQRIGGGYLDALAAGQVQHRAGGGILGGFGGGFGLWGALLGAVVGGGLGYLSGGKKGAIGGALLGGIGGGLYQGSGGDTTITSPGGNITTIAGSGATLTVGEKAVLGLGASAGLGLLASGINTKSSSNPISIAQVAGYKSQLEAQQNAAIAAGRANGQFPYLQIGPQGQSYIQGYTDAPATRRWGAGGLVDTMSAPMHLSGGGTVNTAGTPMLNLSTGGVDAPIIANSNATRSSGSSTGAQVNIKVDINNNSASSSATSNGTAGQPFGSDFANKLNRQIRGVVQDELVQQSRTDGFLTQKGRFLNRA